MLEVCVTVMPRVWCGGREKPQNHQCSLRKRGLTIHCFFLMFIFGKENKGTGLPPSDF